MIPYNWKKQYKKNFFYTRADEYYWEQMKKKYHLIIYPDYNFCVLNIYNKEKFLLVNENSIKGEGSSIN